MPKTHLTITNKQTFAQYWSGSIKETVKAMNKDGIKMAYRTCQRYIADSEVKAFIQAISDEKNGVAEKNEIMIYWGTVMRDEQEDTRNRLRAAELLAKCFGMFLEKHETPAFSIADLLDEDLKNT